MARPLDTLTVKGRRDSLLVIADPNAPLERVLADLQTRLDGTPDFFRGARVVLDVGPRSLVPDSLGQILSLLNRYDIILSALLTADPATRDLAQERGLTTTLPLPGPPRRPKSTNGDKENRCLVIKRTLRSGQVVEHAGHVIILGDVNPGAEVRAGGDVFVWGRVRGIIHAGANGNAQTVVCALELAPMQLRIGDIVARPPDEHARPARPEVARVGPEGIIVEVWSET
ncbi:MAG: septum site-determining protein MinC [Chloroflexi bacterium]|nr:septum site-determining protein MinC [Chloroflexota bacterium]MBU1747894.1 septum site-determining protein MinC [Chloroflexota bacterium]MBU1878654.1 septum site-determining protein MinC [Chloroflexota bacterium]